MPSKHIGDGAMNLTVIDAVRLLRQDLPAKLAEMAPDGDLDSAFLVWWVLSGRREYPAAATTLTEPERRRLFEPLPGWPIRAGLGMNRVLRALLIVRGGVPSTFDLSSPVGCWDALAWFYTQGVADLKLTDCIDQETRAALAGPAFTEGPAELQPSWLMVLLWRRHAPLQAAFDLSLPSGKAGLKAWFAQRGEREFDLQSLLLAAPVPVPDTLHDAAPNKPSAVFGVNLIGFAYGELGIGEDLRMAVQACEAAGIPFVVLNINPGRHLRQADPLLAGHCTEDTAALPYAINLFCLTGFDTLRVFAERGAALFDGRHNIGWWPWELAVWPRRWQTAFSLVDEVWAASRFTQKMYVQTTTKPVTLMPLPVSVDRLKPTSRRVLGLPARRFLFLYVFDANSYLARKNPQAVIDAFQRAFPPTDDAVGLVLKTMNSQPENPAWQALVAACVADPRITLLDRVLDRPVVLGLVKACDAYVSLHRSEGFGRTLAEALLLGKPVVGTNYSGNTDFLTTATGYPVKWKRRELMAGDYPFVETDEAAWWAEPDLAHAARQMRAARAAAGTERALQLSTQAAPRFCPAAIGRRMHAVLRTRYDNLSTAKSK